MIEIILSMYRFLVYQSLVKPDSYSYEEKKRKKIIIRAIQENPCRLLFRNEMYLQCLKPPAVNI